MNHEEIIIDRLHRLEQEIAPLADSARSISELREELAPRVNEAVKALIVELADIEADFQLEDLLFFIKKAMRNVRNLTYSLDQLKNIIDFALIAEPLLKSTFPQIIFYLDDLEQKGVFNLLRSSLETIKKTAETYSAEDMTQIGDGLVRLLGIFKKLTTPEALELLERAAEVPSRVDLSRAEPTGVWGMLWAMGNPEVKDGLGVLLELTKGLSVLKE
ncbi:MAG: DUF1641 domain-containing protein [Deltaproteobacteria bacterium]|jgi:uncharacterized protein YjgD (DUF1641 family)|nr:DUF1641 domain-containing protein [Deltaproteobacteria bacterium]